MDAYCLSFMLLIIWRGVCADLFSSISGMEVLLRTRESVINKLKEYASGENRHIVNSYLTRYEIENKRATADIVKYLGNPINCYILIKSLTTDLKVIEKQLNSAKGFTRIEGMVYPSEEDLGGAVQGLRQLQVVYQLNISRLADGKLEGNFSTPLTSLDCYQLGQMMLYKERAPIEALSWLKAAFRKYNKHDEIYGFNERDVMKLISDIYFTLGAEDNGHKWIRKRALWETGDNVNADEDEVDLNELRQKTENRATKLSKLPESYLAYKTMYARYVSLCRGEVKQDPDLEKRLKCRYLYHYHPFLRLAPMKIEQLYIDPGIYLVHDAISDEHSERLKELATPALTRASITGKAGSVTKYTQRRVTKIAWLQTRDSPVLESLARRIADFTGLRADDAEPMQVANYGIGGAYWPHFDYYNDTLVKFLPKGNRIASIVFYMSDVPQGGATVFLEPGVTVFPKRGAALFWMNLRPSCESDLATLHAACPVLLGSKWVGVVWKHQVGHELIKPCGLSP